VALLEQGDLAGAGQRLEAHLRQSPNDAVARVSLGNIYVRLHRTADALAQYAAARERAPLLAEAHYFEGVAYRKIGALRDAEVALKRALFLAPELWPAAFLLAGIHERYRRPKLARREYRRTLQLLDSGDGSLHVSALGTAGLLPCHDELTQVRLACRRGLGGSGGPI
jgi:tetratricopeptide (TPR) repeat protein